MKTTTINPVNFTNSSLLSEISELNSRNPKKIQALYGELGVDVFEKRKPISIIKKQHDNNILTNVYLKIKNFFATKLEYSENDTVFDVVFKYIYNEKNVSSEDIEIRFGQRGLEEFETMKAMGFITQNTLK